MMSRQLTLHMLAGKLREAETEYRRILAINANNVLARYHLGLTFETQGNRNAARAEYSRFLDLWRDSDPELHERVHVMSVASPSHV